MSKKESRLLLCREKRETGHLPKNLHKKKRCTMQAHSMNIYNVNLDTKPELAVDKWHPNHVDEDISGKASCPLRNGVDSRDAVPPPKI